MGDKNNNHNNSIITISAILFMSQTPYNCSLKYSFPHLPFSDHLFYFWFYHWPPSHLYFFQWEPRFVFPMLFAHKDEAFDRPSPIWTCLCVTPNGIKAKCGTFKPFGVLRAGPVHGRGVSQNQKTRQQPQQQPQQQPRSHNKTNQVIPSNAYHNNNHNKDGMGVDPLLTNTTTHHNTSTNISLRRTTSTILLLQKKNLDIKRYHEQSTTGLFNVLR